MRSLRNGSQRTTPRGAPLPLSDVDSRLECRNGVRRISQVVLPLGLLALTQCASGPSAKFPLPDQAKVAVAYEQPRQGLRQSILGDKLVDPAEFYSRKDSDIFAKVASAPQMQILVDGLAGCGFFEASRTQPEPGAASFLRLEIDGVPQVWSLSAAMSDADRAGYHQALAWFQNVYNRIDAFHTGGGDTDLEALHEQNRRNFEQRTGGRRERP